MQASHPISRSLPIPDFTKCINIDQNNISESNSPISPSGALSKVLAVSLTIHSSTKNSSTRVEKIIHLMKSIDKNFHKLRDEEMAPIARVIDRKFSSSRAPGMVLEIVRKEGAVTRTILLELDRQVAYIFLKTKGGLKRTQGGFKTGTRTLEVKWHDNPDKIQVDKSFLLVLRDDKRQYFSQEPSFEEEVLSKKPELQDYLVLNKVLFSYEKVKKITGEVIPKSAGIYPFMQRDLRAHFNLPGIQYHHIAATMLGVAEALKFLHAAGISHGDIKRANILVDEQGRPKLADFDFSSEYNSETRNISAHSYGTLKYTAPEHLVCDDVMTLDLPALDAWAFGSMLNSLCTQQFKELHDMKIAYKANVAQCKKEMKAQQKIEPATDLDRKSMESTMKNKVQEIHALQMGKVAAADKAAISILGIMGDETIEDGQKDKIFLETLGTMVLHPIVASRPTFKKIVGVLKDTFKVVR